MLVDTLLSLILAFTGHYIFLSELYKYDTILDKIIQLLKAIAYICVCTIVISIIRGQ